ERNYLIDPHTAVAFHVLEEYREETGDDTVTVAVSTASPFKFCSSVLTALGVKEQKSGLDILDQLTEVTGVPTPAPLARLKKRRRRFDDVVDKDAMKGCVLDFLK
ncbi:MAG: threonine synthase, partial [Clostridiales bacterium]|nr:threonine synthase [Clostridiales bacterium]